MPRGVGVPGHPANQERRSVRLGRGVGGQGPAVPENIVVSRGPAALKQEDQCGRSPDKHEAARQPEDVLEPRAERASLLAEHPRAAREGAMEENHLLEQAGDSQADP